MKKILTTGMLTAATIIFGQIGIGTPTPRGALDINKGTTNNMGLVLPTNANVNNIITPQGTGVIPGTIIYDSTNDCMRLYKGVNIWGDCLGDSPIIGPIGGSIGDLDCSSTVNTGTLANGNPASGATSSIPYTGGNGGSYTGQAIPSTGVDGLTATLAPGNFANGNGNIIYTITGTPTSAGTATFTITDIGGQGCSFTWEIGAPNIANLDCARANNIGTLILGAPASGVSSMISYTNGDGSTHLGQTVSSTGVGGLTATLASGNFSSGNGNLTYTITGTPTSVGAAVFTINIGGVSCTLTRNVTNTGGPVGPIGLGESLADMRVLTIGVQRLMGQGAPLNDQVYAYENYGHTGTYGGILRPTHHNDIGSLDWWVNGEGADGLRKEYDVVSVGYNVSYTPQKAALLVEFAKLGGVVVVQLDGVNPSPGNPEEQLAKGFNLMFNAFGMTGSVNNEGDLNATGDSVSSMSNIFGDTKGVLLKANPNNDATGIGGTGKAVKVLPSQLPAGSNIFATTSDGNVAVWTPGGFDGRVIFIWDEGIFRNPEIQLHDINTPVEKYLNNVVAYAFDKAKERITAPPLVSIPGGSLPVARVGTFGTQSVIGHPWSFWQQLENPANYGLAGIYNGISKFKHAGEISTALGNYTGGQLKQKYDILFIGTTDIDWRYMDKLGEFARLGGIVVAQLDPDLSNSRPASIARAFGMSGSIGRDGGGTALTDSANSFGDVWGPTTGINLISEIDNTTLGKASRIQASQLPPGSTIYANETTSGGGVAVWAQGGYDGRVIFMWDEGVLRNSSISGNTVDTPQEKFFHNMISHILDKARGIK